MPTSTPWDGTSWDITAPDIDQPIGNHYKEMFDLRKGVGIRMDKEHITLATSSAGGEHVQGSARAWFQDAVPALQPDGTALAATDKGMLWFDSNSTPDNLAYVLVDHTDPTVGNGWILLSTSITLELIAATHQWAAVQTFDLQSVHTLGILSNASVTLGAGADLIGSATSDITINTDKFTVAGATGNTLVAGTLDVTLVATLGDGSLLAAATESGDADRTIADKAYVDNSVAGDSVTLNDSDTNPLAITNTYEAQTSGFVSGYIADSATIISGFVGGVQVVQTQGGSSAADTFVYFFVPKGVIFQITAGAALTITWTPLVGGGGAPIKQ